MNKALTISEALAGKQSPIIQKAFQFTCPQCGRDNGMTNNPPLRIRCIEFNCFAEIEAVDNPASGLVSTESPSVTTGDQREEFFSMMLLTTIKANGE